MMYYVRCPLKPHRWPPSLQGCHANIYTVAVYGTHGSYFHKGLEMVSSYIVKNIVLFINIRAFARS